MGCLMAGYDNGSISLSLSPPQGETALHVAVRKASLDVADILRKAPGGEKLEQITNEVSAQLVSVKRTCSTSSPFTVATCTSQDGETPSDILSEEGE